MSRSLTLTTVTIVSLGVALVVALLLHYTSALLQERAEGLEQQVDILIFLQPDAPAQGVTLVSDRLEEMVQADLLAGYDLLTPQEVLRAFRELYPEQAELLSAQGVENPFPGVFRLIPKADGSLEDVGLMLHHGDMLGVIDIDRYEMGVTDRDQAMAVLQNLKVIQGFLHVLRVGMYIVIMVMVFLMVSYGLRSRRAEIEVMLQVGAPQIALWLPLMMEALLVMLLGYAVSLVALALIVGFMYGFTDVMSSGILSTQSGSSVLGGILLENLISLIWVAVVTSSLMTHLLLRQHIAKES